MTATTLGKKSACGHRRRPADEFSPDLHKLDSRWHPDRGAARDRTALCSIQAYQDHRRDKLETENRKPLIGQQHMTLNHTVLGSIPGWITIFLSGFVLLTNPNGDPIWIAPDQIIAVMKVEHVGKEDTAVFTQITGPLWVRETPQEVMKKIQQDVDDPNRLQLKN